MAKESPARSYCTACGAGSLPQLRDRMGNDAGEKAGERTKGIALCSRRSSEKLHWGDRGPGRETSGEQPQHQHGTKGGHHRPPEPQNPRADQGPAHGRAAQKQGGRGTAGGDPEPGGATAPHGDGGPPDRPTIRPGGFKTKAGKGPRPQGRGPAVPPTTDEKFWGDPNTRRPGVQGTPGRPDHAGRERREMGQASRRGPASTCSGPGPTRPPHLNRAARVPRPP